ncbi:MAG TPA: helix-turn-helix transcriptional regulator [Candidatus Angelobacter sp.]|nr:helix-turn-helix transcriptional regulator [Candidatus Angelobacter sp.]
MKGRDLREARKSRGLTQEQAAQRLHVTQGYLSMLESEKRSVPEHLVNSLRATFALSPLTLPLPESSNWRELDVSALVREVAAAGYPGFSYMTTKPSRNPAEVLLAALTKDELETRVAESMPWLVLKYHDMDWGWAVREAKVNDVTNRLGFAVTLARELAEKKQDATATEKLTAVESGLRRSVLAREDTFCQERMTQAERQWLKLKSSNEARGWNVLSDLSAEHLTHSANV